MWEMEKLLVTSNISFAHSVFKRLVLQTYKIQDLFGDRHGVNSFLEFCWLRVNSFCFFFFQAIFFTNSKTEMVVILLVNPCSEFDLWLERPPHEREVTGSIPGRDRPKSLKLVVVAFPFGAQNYGNTTTTGLLVSG